MSIEDIANLVLDEALIKRIAYKRRLILISAIAIFFY